MKEGAGDEEEGRTLTFARGSGHQSPKELTPTHINEQGGGRPKGLPGVLRWSRERGSGKHPHIRSRLRARARKIGTGKEEEGPTLKVVEAPAYDLDPHPPTAWCETKGSAVGGKEEIGGEEERRILTLVRSTGR